VVIALDIQNKMARAAEHLQAGRLREAESLFREVLSQNPKHADALHLLGCTASKAGRHDEALGLMRQAIALDPKQSVFHSNLGLVLLVARRIEDAIAEFRIAIALRPESFDIYNHLGNALCELGRFDEAAPEFQRAISSRPQHAPYHYNLANCWMRKGTTMRLDVNPSDLAAATTERLQILEKAVACFQKALALKPDYSEASNNLGNTFQAMGEPAKAISIWQNSVAAKPDFFAYYNLGRAYYEQDLMDEAQAAMESGLRLRPDHAESLSNLGNVYRQTGRPREAIDLYNRALALNASGTVAQSNRLYSLYYHPDYGPDRILLEHQKWNAQLPRPPHPNRPHSNDRSPGRRLRIGYVSPNFWGHCQALFTVPLFSRHDRREFEIYSYSDVKSPDYLTSKIRDLSDVWRTTVGMSVEQMSNLIREDQIDILVDLTVHMAENRMLLFANKPAPAQVTWLGYPGTTGLQTMDYRLTDPFLDPPAETDAFYTEKSIRLPNTFWCVDPEVLEIGEVPPIQPLPALTANHITFGCLNNFCKVNQPLLELWARTLDAVPNSRLILLAPPGSAQAWVRRTLGNRVDFVSRQTRRNYLLLYSQIDIGLDTLPYNGHTTSIDSLWMGVPVITLIGKTVVGRAGLSQLSNVGLAHLAAATPDQFIEIAAKTAADLPALSALRQNLRERTRRSPLMDADRFTRVIESAYRQMWITACK
jgi:protein O-GlcNAc transferase